MINFRLLRHLILFLVVAEEKHFGRAAKRLGMSQPPLSEQIQTLEHALKVKLFDRSRRSVQLTPAGAALVPVISKLAEQMERVEFAAREVAAGRHGLLVIGSIQSAMGDPLPMVIKNTQKLLPEFTISVIEVDSGDVAQAVENGDIDVAFSRLNGALGPLISSKALIHDQLVVAVPSDHHLSEKKAISLTDLVNEDFVMCPRSITPTYFDAIMAACKKNNFSPRIVHEARSVSAQISLVGCAQGVALVPRNVSIPKGVITKPLKEKVNVVTLSISWNPARETEAVRNVIKTASTLLKTKVQD